MADELAELRAECIRLRLVDREHRKIAEEAESQCRDLARCLTQVRDLLQQIRSRPQADCHRCQQLFERMATLLEHRTTDESGPVVAGTTPHP